MSRGCWISWWQPCRCRCRADPRSAGRDPDARSRWRSWYSAFCSAGHARVNSPSLRVTNSWHALAATRASLKQKAPGRSTNHCSPLGTGRDVARTTLRLRAPRTAPPPVRAHPPRLYSFAFRETLTRIFVISPIKRDKNGLTYVAQIGTVDRGHVLPVRARAPRSVTREGLVDNDR